MLFLFQELMWQLATWQVATSFLACRWRNCAIVLPSAAEAQEGPMAWHCARVLRGTWPVSRPVAPPALSCATTTPRRLPAQRAPNVRVFWRATTGVQAPSRSFPPFLPAPCVWFFSKRTPSSLRRTSDHSFRRRIPPSRLGSSAGLRCGEWSLRVRSDRQA